MLLTLKTLTTSRRMLLTLMVTTTVGLLISTVLLGREVHKYFIVEDEYFEQCDASVRDNVSERSFPEATRYLAQRDIKKPAFFFIETSCIGNVNARQACAVESAAKLHPGADVYLLLLSPPPSLNLTSNPSLQILLDNYINIHILYVHLQDYFRNSLLDEWYRSGVLKNSLYQQSHTSDVFRFYTLWKYGGTYLDLDIVLTKSLDGLSNYAGAESSQDIAAGVLNFQPPKSSLSFQCVRELRDNFKGDDWGNNGPGVITRVLQRLCHTKDTKLMTREKCQGFVVMPPSAFYPIPWKRWKLYFDEALSNITMKLLANSYGIHVWNKFSKTQEIHVGSKQPYGLIAQKFCPRVYENAGRIF